MNVILLLISLLCSLTSSTVYRQGSDLTKPETFSRLLSKYLVAESGSHRKHLLKWRLDAIFSDLNELFQADSWDNFKQVLRTRNQDWITRLIGHDSGALIMRRLYSNPPKKAIYGQAYAQSPNGRMQYFSIGLGAHASIRIFNQPAWLKFMYKAVRGIRNTFEEQQIIAKAINEHNNVQVAVCILVGDDLHMWRRGSGAFLVIGTMGRGTKEAVIFPKPHHNVDFGTPCDLTYSVTRLRASDAVFFVQTIGNEGNGQVISTDDLLTICQDQSKVPDILGKSIGNLFAEKYRQHGHFRLDAFHIQNNRR